MDTFRFVEKNISKLFFTNFYFSLSLSLSGVILLLILFFLMIFQSKLKIMKDHVRLYHMQCKRMN